MLVPLLNSHFVILTLSVDMDLLRNPDQPNYFPSPAIPLDRLRVQNAVSAQPCVGKLGISLVLLNFLGLILDCGLKLHKLSIHTLVMLQK